MMVKQAEMVEDKMGCFARCRIDAAAQLFVAGNGPGAEKSDGICSFFQALPSHPEIVPGHPAGLL